MSEQEEQRCEEKPASQLEPGDVLLLNDRGREQLEEVLFRAWSDDGEVLIWTDGCEVHEPIRLDESALVQVGS